MSTEDRKAEQERLAKERVELLKLKQGLIEESEVLAKEPIARTQLTLKGKFDNFMYHNKFYVLGGVLLVFLLILLLADLISREASDLRLLIVTDEFAVSQKLTEFEIAFEQVSEDFDENGKIHVELFPVYFYEDSNNQSYIANQTKLSGELQVAEAMLIICDDASSSKIMADTMLTNLAELYPGNEHVKVNRYYLKGTNFAKLMDWENCPEDLYVGVRSYEATTSPNNLKTKERYDNAMKVLDKIISMG